MLPVIEAYKQDFPMPRQSINPAEKTADYHKRWASYIYSLYITNKTSWGIASYDRFQELRDYSCGRQSTDRYKKWLVNDWNTGSSTSSVSVDSFDDLPIAREAKRKGWFNVLFDNISPAPTIMDAIHGMLDKLDYDLFVNVIDPESKELEENEAYLKFFEGQNLAWQNEYKLKAGIPIDENTFYPKSVQEFEMFKAQDGFKLNIARAMQKLLRYTFSLPPAEWETVVRKKVVDDLLCIGYGATRDYYDSEDSKFKVKWIDPARLVIQASSETDYHDAEYGGYFTLWTVSNLKQKLPDVDEDTWKNLSKGAMGRYGNPANGWETRYSLLDPSTYLFGYDGFKIPVFEAEWIDTDVQKRQYYTDRYGHRLMRELDYNEAGKNTAKKEAKSVPIRHVRQCNWVVGTDYCFDWGVLNMASRKNHNKPQLTFHVEQLLQPSLMERLAPIFDQIELNFLKYQNSLAKMIENGYTVNVNMLGNVALGGQKLKVAEVIKLFKESGFLLYQYSPGTGLYTGGAAQPITAIEGGMKNRVEETIRTLQMWMDTIRSMTGIDIMTISNTPVGADDKETDKVQPKLLMSILKPIVEATKEIKQSAGECLMRRIQIGVTKNETIRRSYAGAVSGADMQGILRMKDTNVQYGLSLKSRPDREAVLTFVKWIDIALQNTTEQRPGIDLNDAIFLKSQLDNGVDINELEKQLGYIILKNKEQSQANSERMMQVQAEENRKTEEAKMQGELMKIRAQAEASIAEEQIRGQIKERESNKQITADLYKSMREEAAAEAGINISGGR